MENLGNILIYGAGASGVLINELLNANNLGNPIAFIDDNIKLAGKQLVGLKILHSQSVDEKYIRDHNINIVFLSNLSVHLNRSQYIRQLGVKSMLLKDLDSWNNGVLSTRDIIEVDSSFIINRISNDVLDTKILKNFQHKKVMITGAAGSIGSEIVRQLINCVSVSVIMVDINESGLHDLSIELGNPENLTFFVCDISNEFELKKIFKENIDIDHLFHAAAYKHVPIVESNPYPAIRVNISGTNNLCKLSLKYGVSNFTLISTDKAVNPTNLMGATKRLAELIVLSYNEMSNSSVVFSCTRFGNVLGSRGSAIPLFIEQIKAGGPITLTSSEMTRFFMTIPEASQLVIASSTLAEGSIYILDMGTSIKLTDIIENLLNYYERKDIEIKVTGLRDGEKLYEELASKSERLIPASIPKINVVEYSETTLVQSYNKILDFLINYQDFNLLEIKDMIKDILPEYKPN